MNTIGNINNKFNISFLRKNPKTDENQKQTQGTDKPKETLETNLAGLGTIGMAEVLISKNKTPNLSDNKPKEKCAAIFRDGVAYNEKGELFNGELVKTNSSGEEFNIQIKDGIIQQSTKTSPDGSISWVKKYSKNKYNQKIVDIFVPNENNEMELSERVLLSKDKIAIFKGENIVEQYWYNTPKGWKKIDNFIDKSDIKNNQNPILYYLNNGIQINTFLRDGEFRHPKDSVDKIHYEYLDDPQCPEFYKNDIRKIMRDNRFILDSIDNLDRLTHTSKTNEPITVYRNAPCWWINKAKDGILKEDAFCSTSTEKGASLEGLILGKYAKDGVTYTIHLPEGTPYLDLTTTNEKEMLLPRKKSFRVLSNTELEYIPE